jgi:GAF domain-containing protein
VPASNRTELLAQLVVDLLDVQSTQGDLYEMFSVLVDGCAELFDASAVALLMTTSRSTPRLVASKVRVGDADALFEIQRLDGPCTAAIASNEVVSAANLEEHASRWPEFAAIIGSAGYRGVHAIPVSVRGKTLGSLTLFTEKAQMLNETELRVARTVAMVAAVIITMSRALQEADEMVTQLQRSLGRRITTEQAKGMVARRLDVEIEDADEMMAEFASQSKRKTIDVARDIVNGLLPIDRISRSAPAGSL